MTMPFQPTFTRDPVDQDAIDYIESLGLTDAVGNNLGILLQPVMGGSVLAALADFYKGTGLYQMIPGATAIDTFIDPPGSQYRGASNLFPLIGGQKIVMFPYPIVSVNSVYVGITSTNTVGTLLDPTNYVLFPYNQDFTGLPYRGFTTYIPVFGGYQGIRVNGFPGSYAEWPEDAWMAVMKMGLASVMEELGALVSGGLLRWQESDSSEFLGSSPFGAMKTKYEMSYARVLRRYRRPL